MKPRICRLLAAFFLLLAYYHGAAQSCPPNLDFEKGDFSNWQCFTGFALSANGQNYINLDTSVALSGRHEIITPSSLPRKDRYGNFPIFCPYGGGYSVKLGNEGSGGEAEGMSYTFTVPTTIDTFTFTYFYAVVFEDPAHSIEEQPRFFVTAYEVESGKVINCASFDYVSNGTLPGFKRSALNQGVLYKEWSPTSLQFAGLGGKAVRLEFKTADCTLGGHFGYAYVDVGSGCSNILATAPYCIETNSLILNAPYGFKKYTWYTEDFSQVVGHDQSITFTPPPATSGVFNVDVEPYPGYGCRDTFHAVIKPLPVPDTPSVPDAVFCQNTYAPMLEATASPGNDLVWYIADTTQPGSELAPVPPTHKPDTLSYYVSQKTLFGCESFRKKLQVAIVPTPITSFTCRNTRQCEVGNRFVFRSTTTNKLKSVYYWDFGDGTSQSSETDSVVTHTYTKSGDFFVTLKVTNAATCSAEQTMMVTVVPKPVAQFNYPAIICEKQTVVSVTDQSSVPGGVASLNKWWWDFNGTILKNQNPASFVPDSAGSMFIKLVVTTAEGCISDTASVKLAVHYRPAAAIGYGALLCNNEVLHFTDKSYLPQGATGEAVAKWDWQIGNAVSGAQNPALQLTPGVYGAQLVAETAFGCRSLPADSLFTVHAAPQIGLTISDSCVFRTIEYKALDLQQTVHSWHWDFGAGWKQGDSLIIKTFAKEGYRPLQLIGKTVEGCKDTIIRPFTIYDNDAFAGRDTITAMGEPVQLNANGGTNNTYLWTPSIGLSNPTIEAPVAVLDRDQLYQLDAITREGCDSRSRILIRRYKGPELYIPTAFTPNYDGKNDVLRVFPVGIKKFHYLAVYNRSGELIFRTTDYNKGWNGKYKGSDLSTATFIAVSEATDYRGKPMLSKVAVTLIR